MGIFPASADLTACPDAVPAWDSLNANQKLNERMMEIYAEYLSQTDYNLGRVVDVIQQMGPGIRPCLIEGRTTLLTTTVTPVFPKVHPQKPKNRSYTITGDLEIPQKGAEGMIITQGGLFGGWAFYLDKGKPTFHYTTVNNYHYNIASPQVLPAGKHSLVADFKNDGGGMGKGATVTLSSDGKQIARGRV